MYRVRRVKDGRISKVGPRRVPVDALEVGNLVCTSSQSLRLNRKDDYFQIKIAVVLKFQNIGSVVSEINIFRID